METAIFEENVCKDVKIPAKEENYLEQNVDHRDVQKLEVFYFCLRWQLRRIKQAKGMIY